MHLLIDMMNSEVEISKVGEAGRPAYFFLYHKSTKCLTVAGIASELMMNKAAPI
jgi:hypothetical protein